MVQVGDVRMAVPCRMVHMRVAVWTRRPGAVRVVMMAIVMGMGMLVRQRLMHVFVGMGLAQVNDNACHHH